MVIIGHADKFYTQWERFTEFKYAPNGQPIEKIHKYYFRKNLSMDLDKAKAKISETHKEFEVDVNLRGEKWYFEKREKIELPADVFQFGKYQFEKIEKCPDIMYVAWYFRETQSEFAKALLLDNGYVEYNGKVITKKERDELVREAEVEAMIAKAEKGHVYEDGTKVTIRIREINFFSFDGAWGRTYVATYITDDGKIVKYMGGSPSDISKDEFTKVSATVKHDYYKEPETKLQRIKILK